jgi:general nucleoside transport system permease protein
VSDAAPLSPGAAPRAARLGIGVGVMPRVLAAIALSMASAAALVALSGHDPLEAFAAIAEGAAGSPHQIGVALNRATPYLLAGSGVALCFRAGVINIGAEGQIALGGAGAAAVALVWPSSAAPLTTAAALIGACLCGAVWAGVATAIHLGRRVHEVLATLLLNFVAVLIVQQAPAAAWLWKVPDLGAHSGFALALVVSAALSLLMWRTPFGFALRVAGASRQAAAYAGFSINAITWSVMALAGALAGLAGGVEVLGVHHRLIEGFSLGFGFKAVTVALLGALEPLAVVPAALFVGLLEAGAQSMQRQIGVPSALVVVIEGLTMLFVLAATARRA